MPHLALFHPGPARALIESRNSLCSEPLPVPRNLSTAPPSGHQAHMQQLAISCVLYIHGSSWPGTRSSVGTMDKQRGHMRVGRCYPSCLQAPATVFPAINTRTLTTHRRRMLSDTLPLYMHTYIQYCHRPPDEPSIQQALCITQRMCLPGHPCSRARILEARKVSGSSPRPRHPAPVPNLPRYSRIALSLASSRLLLRYNLMATKPR